jgi:hypothetical protein
MEGFMGIATITTKEEKAARVQAAREALAALTPEEKATKAAGMAFSMVTGHPLSIHNICFLLYQSQGAALSIFGGFNQWRAAGRRVRQGERAYRIFAPISKREKVTQGGEEVTVINGVRFRMVAVFDISQTEPIEAGEA